MGMGQPNPGQGCWGAADPPQPSPLRPGAFWGPTPLPPTSSISKPNLPAVLVGSSYPRDGGTQRTEESRVRKTGCFFLCFPALGVDNPMHDLLTLSQCYSCCINVGVAHACKSLLALVLTTSAQVSSLHMPGENHLTPSL